MQKGMLFVANFSFGESKKTLLRNGAVFKPVDAAEHWSPLKE